METKMALLVCGRPHKVRQVNKLTWGDCGGDLKWVCIFNRSHLFDKTRIDPFSTGSNFKRDLSTERINKLIIAVEP